MLCFLPSHIYRKCVQYYSLLRKVHHETAPAATTAVAQTAQSPEQQALKAWLRAASFHLSSFAFTISTNRTITSITRSTRSIKGRRKRRPEQHPWLSIPPVSCPSARRPHPLSARDVIGGGHLDANSFACLPSRPTGWAEARLSRHVHQVARTRKMPRFAVFTWSLVSFTSLLIL